MQVEWGMGMETGVAVPGLNARVISHLGIRPVSARTFKMRKFIFDRSVAACRTLEREEVQNISMFLSRLKGREDV
jgi:hypothetical protein